jgi:ABC-type glycerol-3-phosphate transport system substrate-binding protein
MSGKMITTESGFKIPEIKLSDKKIDMFVIGEPLDLMPKGAIYENVKKFYGGELVLTSLTVDTIFTTLSTSILSGDAPDLVAGHGGFPDVMINDLIEPVDGFADYSLDVMKHLKGAYDTYTFDNKHWMLPIDDIHTSAVFYNKSIFEDNDLTTPRDLFKSGNWTWDKLKEYAKVLTLDKNKDGTPERWGLGMVGWHRGRFVLTTGENVIKITGSDIQSNLSSPNIERAYNFLFDIVFKDKSTSPNGDMFFVHNGLDTGEIAMVMSADFLALRPRFFPNLKLADNLEFVPYPKDPKAAVYTAAGYANGFYLPKGAVNKDGAKAFVYGAAATLNERYIPGQTMYQSQLDENLKTINGLKPETYAKYVEWYAEYRQMTKLTDAYNALLDPELPYSTATPEGVLVGYKQAVAQIEPLVKEKIDTMKK